MTPLAAAIVKDSCMPKPQRRIASGKLPSKLLEAQFFELTEVVKSAKDLAVDIHRRKFKVGRLAFLPAPNTWIEFRETSGRIGVLLQEHENRATVPFMAVHLRQQRIDVVSSGSWLALGEALDKAGERDSIAGTIFGGVGIDGAWVAMIYACIALINTPRLIGRRQRMPNSGLQRTIARSRGMTGKFPLRAWTEIRLAIETKMADPTVEHAACLSGKKALHFVRSHSTLR